MDFQVDHDPVTLQKEPMTSDSLNALFCRYLQAIGGGAAGSKSLELYATRIQKRDFAPGTWSLFDSQIVTKIFGGLLYHFVVNSLSYKSLPL